MISIAPLRGTKVSYEEYPFNYIMITKQDGTERLVSNEIFEKLYFIIDNEFAACKEDCIFYASYRSDKPIDCYPEWFRSALRDGYIFEDSPDEPGDIPLGPNSIVLMNFMGDFKHMDRRDFDKYYERVFYCSY